MDASTLTFPKSALCARRPDGMIEYALYDVSNDTYRLICETVIDGTRATFTIVLGVSEIQDTSGTIDNALELRRPEAIKRFSPAE